MSELTSSDSLQINRLRVWPGVVAVVAQWLLRFVVPVLVPGAAIIGLMGSLVAGIIVLVWWLFFSRAPWAERLGALLLIVVATFATSRVVHESIATGMMGMMFYISAVPGLTLALVAWAVATRRLTRGPRLAALLAAVVLACGGWAFVRTNGLDGNADSDLEWADRRIDI